MCPKPRVTSCLTTPKQVAIYNNILKTEFVSQSSLRL